MEDLEKETPKTEEETPAQTEAEESEKQPQDSDAYKFNLAFLGSFAGAMLMFFIELAFGRVLYGLAMFAFIGICIQFAEFYIKSKKVSLLVTACLSGAAALTMLILSIVALCVA